MWINLTGKIHCNCPSFVLGYFQVSTLKKALSSFFLPDILWPLSGKIRYLGDERSLLDLNTVRYFLALTRKNICLNRQRSNKDHTPTRCLDKFKVSDLVYIKNHATSTLKPKWESGFHLIKYSPPTVLSWRVF